ncbi:AAA family ATPase [Archangium sp.]|uniref:AAA family ATPase n=1 Tax=Archangium sp. TaxID=1872627 RepID=UPI0039C89E92
MLDWFEIERFKSFRHAQLPLAELTVLIGANASGKSNLLEGLRLLSWLARGKRLGEIAYALRAEERRLDVRGPITRLVHDGALSFALGITLRDEQVGQVDLRISLDLRQDGLQSVASVRASSRRGMRPWTCTRPARQPLMSLLAMRCTGPRCCSWSVSLLRQERRLS